jgi:hypothetical protein
MLGPRLRERNDLTCFVMAIMCTHMLANADADDDPMDWDGEGGLGLDVLATPPAASSLGVAGGGVRCSHQGCVAATWDGDIPTWLPASLLNADPILTKFPEEVAVTSGKYGIFRHYVRESGFWK